MSDNYPDTKYFRHLQAITLNTSLQEVKDYGNSLLTVARQYINNEIAIEEFEQLVPAIEQSNSMHEEIEVLNYIRGMLIKSMPIGRSN